ncbi:armadillo-type protein [Mycena rebaudengoi]|nr:armadillo-type protein [Mycena rebaudengoi]
MFELHRTATRQSTQSWWSNPNPLGATISLHTLAKPLTKVLYHRQASRFISRSRGSRLSEQDLELIKAYLESNDIGPRTKVMILRDLVARAETDDEAQVISHKNTLDYFLDMLCTPDLDECVFQQTCQTFVALAQHQSNVIEAQLCVQLVALVTHPALTVQRNAAYALCRLHRWREDAAATLNANAVVSVIKCLESDDEQVLMGVCKILIHVADNESFTTILLAERSWQLLAKLLSHPDVDIQKSAIHVLSKISHWSGTRTVVSMSAKSLEEMAALLRSPDKQVVGYAWNTLCNIYQCRGDFDVPAVGLSLVTLLKYPELGLRKPVRRTLTQINRFFPVSNYVESLDEVVAWVCAFLVYLTDDKSFPRGVVGTGTCPQLVKLLEHPRVDIRRSAIHVLSKVTYLTSAASLTEPNAVGSVIRLLESPDEDVLVNACATLRHIVAYLADQVWHYYYSPLPHETADIAAAACPRLVQLLGNPTFNVNIHRDVIETLHGLSSVFSESTSRAVTAANILPCIASLLRQSSDEIILLNACGILANIAKHEPLRKTVVKTINDDCLVPFLEHRLVGIRKEAKRALGFMNNERHAARIRASLRAARVIN